MKKLLLLSLAGLAAGCTQYPDQAAELSPAAQSELAAALAGRTPGQPVSCINMRGLGGNRSIGDLVLFGNSNQTIYVSNTRGGCDLGPGEALVTRTPTNQLCTGEIATVVDTATGFTTGSCSFGEFTPYRR